MERFEEICRKVPTPTALGKVLVWVLEAFGNSFTTISGFLNPLFKSIRIRLKNISGFQEIWSKNIFKTTEMSCR
jgi:hypothetical protein